MAQRKTRLARELDMLARDPPPGITARVVPGAEPDAEREEQARAEAETENRAGANAAAGAEARGGAGKDEVRLRVTMLGPANTPYAGGRFELDVRLTAQYPFDAPGVRFVTKIYHPNVDQSGRICLDSLKLPPAGAWRPSLNLVQVLSQIQILLGEPGLGDPLRPEIADLIKSDREQYERTAREWTLRFAGAPGGAPAPGGPGAPGAPAAVAAGHAERGDGAHGVHRAHGASGAGPELDATGAEGAEGAAAAAGAGSPGAAGAGTPADAAGAAPSAKRHQTGL